MGRVDFVCTFAERAKNGFTSRGCDGTVDAAMAKRAEKSIEDLAVGESIAQLSVGPQDEVWSACGMTWESRSVRLPKRIPLFGFGPNKFYAYRVHVKRVA